MSGGQLGTDLNGKVALVTGSSKGIGEASALKLAELGLKVAVNYHTSEASARNVVETIKCRGGESVAVRADVSQRDQAKAMIEEVTAKWGPVEVLVNNAGIIDDGLLIRMSDEAWDRVISTNLNGTFYCTRAVLRSMVRARWGRVINISSVVGIRGNAGQSNYAASKAAVNGFTKSLAKEVANRNITVNAITPGYIRTDTVDVLPQELKDRILAWIPQGHFGEVDDVAHMVAYLATDKAKYITGQIISVDGGMAM